MLIFWNSNYSETKKRSELVWININNSHDCFMCFQQRGVNSLLMAPQEKLCNRRTENCSAWWSAFLNKTQLIQIRTEERTMELSEWQSRLERCTFFVRKLHANWVWNLLINLGSFQLTHWQLRLCAGNNWQFCQWCMCQKGIQSVSQSWTG